MDDFLTREDLEFLRRASKLLPSFEKLRRAKALIAEARHDIERALAGLRGEAKPKPKSTTKPPAIDFGVDLPPDLSDTEKALLEALKSAVLPPRDAAKAAGLSQQQAARAFRKLSARRLARAAGTTVNRTWRTR